MKNGLIIIIIIIIHICYVKRSYRKTRKNIQEATARLQGKERIVKLKHEALDRTV
jgi:preprotein translocase subunit YajC